VSEPISFLVASGVVAAAAVPLVLELVPPNRLYGFRTAQTLSDRELWFRTNRFAGWALLVAAAASVSAYVFAPELASGRSFLGLIVFAVPLVLALLASAAYLRKTIRSKDHGRSGT
jgi:uncharacterized membrane protein